MDKKSKIYISGHNGMVGSAMVNLLNAAGYKNLIFQSSNELDLRKQEEVERFFQKHLPEFVFHFAARVGGIRANMNHPVEFLYDTTAININVIHAAYTHGVKKLLYLGSSCMYPRNCLQPMKEEYLLSGKLEPTNEGYALAKITGLKLCEYFNRQFDTNYISLIPPNLYGPLDNFDPETSHVVPGLIRKFVEAKADNAGSLELWGSGNARREFCYVEELAGACLYFMEKYQASDLPPFVNVGVNSDVSIRELSEIISSETGYPGKITWNTSMPDGMPQKLLDSNLARKLGWETKISLREGIKRTIAWYESRSLHEKFIT